VVHASALWGIGVVGGYQVAFRDAWGPSWGIAGMWMMQAIALALAAALLVSYYLGSVHFRRARVVGREELGQRGSA
jgi:Na+-driven multidrug efflux pump